MLCLVSIFLNSLPRCFAINHLYWNLWCGVYVTFISEMGFGPVASSVLLTCEVQVRVTCCFLSDIYSSYRLGYELLCCPNILFRR